MDKTILYIEDNAANRILVHQVLGGHGYNIIEAEDGLSGIQVAKQARPDLILMDINVPGIDGYEAATRIKSLPELGDIPIVALTAKVMAGDRERALAAGCDGYIAKPIDIDTLPQQVAEFLGGKRETISAEYEPDYLREYSERLVDHLEQKVIELTHANEALSRTDAMKSRFINLAAHELRTPLAAVHGYLSLLLMPDNKFLTNVDNETMEIIYGIATGVDRLRGIVQDMLDITRIESGTLQLKCAPVNILSLLQRIEQDFETIITQRQQKLIIYKKEAIPAIWADGERITQILRNLISNAVKYTPNGGTITIDIEIIGHQQDIKNIPSPHRFVKITVEDTGIGISVDQLELIFEKFYEVRDIEQHSTSKTDFMGGGTGLGLPIARGVAEAHDGSLWAESKGYDPEKNPGSKFHLILPIGQSPKEYMDR